jgi:hypothetical protein
VTVREKRRVEVDKVDALVRELGQLTQIVRAIEDTGLKERYGHAYSLTEHGSRSHNASLGY